MGSKACFVQSYLVLKADVAIETQTSQRSRVGIVFFNTSMLVTILKRWYPLWVQVKKPGRRGRNLR